MGRDVTNIYTDIWTDRIFSEDIILDTAEPRVVCKSGKIDIYEMLLSFLCEAKNYFCNSTKNITIQWYSVLLKK